MESRSIRLSLLLCIAASLLAAAIPSTTASAKELERRNAMRTSGIGAGYGNSQMNLKLRRLLAFKPNCSKNQTACRSRCVDLMADVNNCGACGNFCEVPLDCCGGTCVDLRTNYEHCGACGASCQGICTSSTCFKFD
ncbi:unnamed protein product [Closterium sp. Yama58-4]|nr:unnamed protein product [Closterium sp. Yama58-4]